MLCLSLLCSNLQYVELLSDRWPQTYSHSTTNCENTLQFTAYLSLQNLHAFVSCDPNLDEPSRIRSN